MKNIFTFLKKHSSIIINALGIIGTLFGLYSYFFPLNQSPNLVYYNKSTVDVFKLNDTIDNLEIQFNGKDIRKQNLNLRVYTVKLINEGKSDIELEHYDKKVPFGLEIRNGFIIGFDILNSNDPYINNELHPNYTDSNKIVFNNIIIGKEKFVEFKITVIHNASINPELAPIGKISNTNLTITSSEEGNTSAELLILVCGLALIILIVAFITLFFNGMSRFGLYLQAVYRKKEIKKYYEHNFDPQNKIQRVLIRIYSETGKHSFHKLLNILRDNEKLNHLLKSETEILNTITKVNILYTDGKISFGPDKKSLEYTSDFLTAIEILEKDELIKTEENRTVTIVPELLEEIEKALKLY